MKKESGKLKMINILVSRTSFLTSEKIVEKLKEILKPHMKVAVLAFSHFNNLKKEEYFEKYNDDSVENLKIKNVFKTYDITNINWIYYYNFDIKESLNILETADILYLPGGAPDLMMSRIKEKMLLEKIKKFKKIIIGSSAGAMIQLSKYHISKDNEYQKFSINEGLGFIDDFFIEVHFKKRKNQKKSLRKMNKLTKKKIYVIADDGLLIKKDGIIKTLKNAKLYYENGKKIKY